MFALKQLCVSIFGIATACSQPMLSCYDMVKHIYNLYSHFDFVRIFHIMVQYLSNIFTS